MQSLQMYLFGADEPMPSAEELETRVKVLNAYNDAMKYGYTAASRTESYEVLCAQLVGYADGVAIQLGLGAGEKELLRNYAFSAADPIMLAKQH